MVKLAVSVVIFLVCFVISLHLIAAHKTSRTAAVLQSSTLRIQPSPSDPQSVSYEPKINDAEQEGSRRPKHVASASSPYSKRYHYASSDKAGQYGRIYDAATKSYEMSPTKISYEIKLYIPKHEPENTGGSRQGHYEEPPPEYAPYEERSLYSSKLSSYMKPYYTPDGRTVYESRPTYTEPVAKVEKRPVVMYPEYEQNSEYRPIPDSYSRSPAEVYRTIYRDPPTYDPPVVYKMDSPPIYTHRPTPVYEIPPPQYRPLTVYRQYEPAPAYEAPKPAYELADPGPAYHSGGYRVRVKPEGYGSSAYSASYEPPYDQQQMKSTYEKASKPSDVYVQEPKDTVYTRPEPVYYEPKPAVYYAMSYQSKPVSPPESVPISYQPPLPQYVSNTGYGAYANY